MNVTVNDLRKRISQARGKEKADLVIRGAKIVNVLTHEIMEGDVAVCDGVIIGAGGSYEGKETVNVSGYLLPGFIDSHIHVESSMLVPARFGALLAARGTTTAIADPHEIMNVAGIPALEFMLESGKKSPIDLLFMMASCVPATPWEHSGAVIEAPVMEEAVLSHKVLGLGEMMNFSGVLFPDNNVLEKIALAHKAGSIVDGHSPGLSGKDLAAYAAAGISTDHECSTVEEMEERLRNGMYVQLRYGSACLNLPDLARGVTPGNAHRCLLCSDDIQPLTLRKRGSVDAGIRVLVSMGIDPIDAVSMASHNAAVCYGLRDRGAIAPGLIADLVLVDDLSRLNILKVWKRGVLTACEGECLAPEPENTDYGPITKTMHVKDFSEKKMKMHLRHGLVRTIRIIPGGVVTGEKIVQVKTDPDGDFVFDEEQDVCRLCVVERHQSTGNVSCALLSEYGIKRGAVAASIAHDSHNIIVAGTNTADMAAAVEEVIRMEGGMTAVLDGKVLASLALPVGGLMSERDAEYVTRHLDRVQNAAHTVLGVRGDIEPVMTLCFLALPVIPVLRLTDLDLFDVRTMKFTDICVD